MKRLFLIVATIILISSITADITVSIFGSYPSKKQECISETEFVKEVIDYFKDRKNTQLSRTQIKALYTVYPLLKQIADDKIFSGYLTSELRSKDPLESTTEEAGKMIEKGEIRAIYYCNAGVFVVNYDNEWIKMTKGNTSILEEAVKKADPHGVFIDQMEINEILDLTE